MPADTQSLENGSEDDGNDDVHVVKLSVRKRSLGSRLDKYLCGRFPRMSRTILQRLIKEGGVTVNGLPTKPSYEPRRGDLIEIVIPPPEPTDVVPEDIPIDVVYEDHHLLAINKAAGIICHPSRFGQTGTLANALVHYARSLRRAPDPFRPGIVHRLDKNTTGVMLVAKCDEAHWRLSLQFERRTVRKTYVAVVEGRLPLDGDVIDQPLAANPIIKDRYVTPGRDTRGLIYKEAVTRYAVLERFAGFTFVELSPKTGRTHQLRVHMSSIGHPIFGDTHYGGHLFSERDLTGSHAASTDPLLTHQALHALRIKLMHPIKETSLTIEAPISPKLQHVIDLLRESRRIQRSGI